MQQVVENVKENRYSTSTIKLIKEIIVYQSWHDGLASPRDEVNAPGLISWKRGAYDQTGSPSRAGSICTSSRTGVRKIKY